MSNLLDGVFNFFCKTHAQVVHTYELIPEAAQLIRDQLSNFIAESKPFLRPRYGIRDLANDLKIPSYQISAFLNREIGLNF